MQELIGEMSRCACTEQAFWGFATGETMKGAVLKFIGLLLSSFADATDEIAVTSYDHAGL